MTYFPISPPELPSPSQSAIHQSPLNFYVPSTKAAKKYGCKAVGYDIDPELVEIARRKSEAEGVEKLVTIERADVFTVDLTNADVVTLYLLPQQNEKLVGQLMKMKPGSRVVSHQFEIPGIKPESTTTVESKEGGEKHVLVLYKLPLQSR